MKATGANKSHFQKNKRIFPSRSALPGVLKKFFRLKVNDTIKADYKERRNNEMATFIIYGMVHVLIYSSPKCI